MNIPTIKLSRDEFIDLPIADSQEEACRQAVPMRVKSQTGQWLLFGNPDFPDGAVIDCDDITEPVVSNRSTPDAMRRYVAPKQDLNTLLKWRVKWVKAQERGLHKLASETATEFNARSMAFADKCVRAIAEIDRAIAARQSPASAVRCALPKKLQRKMGLLPAIA